VTTPSSPATSPSPSFADELKARTQPRHTAAERHAFHHQLFTGALPLTALASQHAAVGRIQAALEKALDRADCPDTARLFQPHHRRAVAFAEDLHRLGVDTAHLTPAGPEENAFIADLAHLAPDEPRALLGVLYVLEGSTNGGQFIQRAIAKHHPHAELRALNPHGDAVRSRWARFRAELDALALSPADRDAIAAWADRTFDTISAVMSRVMAGVTPASAPAR
jgi:heme oxygenase